MKKLLAALAVAGLMGASAQADVTVTVDSSTMTLGWMHVYDTPQNGGGYQWGSGWGTADLNSTFPSATDVTLSPNTIGDPDPYWYTPAGGPGSVGNKIMDASLYAEDTGTLNGETVVFTADVLSDTLTLLNNPSNYDANTNGWTAIAWIKDFAPDYSVAIETNVVITPGVFSLSMDTINDPTRHVQYGFTVVGPNVWSTDVAPYGDIQIAAIPEPATMGLVGIFGAGILWFRRRRV